MINDPFGIITVLLVIEGVVVYAAERPRLSRLFKVIPFMFWIYFLPIVAVTVGLIPPESNAADQVITPVYRVILKYCLPACLILLLLNVDFLAILRLGPVALAIMAAGALGVMIGGPVVLAIFGRWMPVDVQSEMWKGIGALSGSWTGGSTNLLAVAEGLHTPGAITGMIIIVDTVVAYAWMGLLMLMAGRQDWYDRRFRSRMDLLDELRRRAAADGPRTAHPITLGYVMVIFGIAAAGTAGAIYLGQVAFDKFQVLSGYTWAVILASTFGLALSFTPVRRLERFGTSSVGYALLYLVLASIGAKTSLANLAGTPILILAGVVWVLIHGVFLLTAGRLLRAPLALIATASQANIGGVASAPVVAEVYLTGLAPVALLLAVLGNIAGTYLGLCCAALCKMVSQW